MVAPNWQTKNYALLNVMNHLQALSEANIWKEFQILCWKGFFPSWVRGLLVSSERHASAGLKEGRPCQSM